MAPALSGHAVARMRRGSDRGTAFAQSSLAINPRGWKGASNAGRTHRRGNRQGHAATVASRSRRSAKVGDVVPGHRLGIGTTKKDGSISYRGACYYQSAAPAWGRLNSIAGIFDYEVDAQGNT